MKKSINLHIFFTIVFISLSCVTIAQKVYSTKNGQLIFNATGGIEKIIGVNNQVESKFVDATGQIIFGVLIKGFKFENQLLEDHFNENYMESSKFPKADFKGYIKNSKEINFTLDGKYPIIIEGDLTIHNTTKKIKATGHVDVVKGTPTISGEFMIRIKDYGISGLYIGDKIAADATIKLKCKY